MLTFDNANVADFYVHVPDNTALHVTSFTVETWVNFTVSPPQGSGFEPMIGMPVGSAYEDSFGLWYEPADTSFHAGVNTSNDAETIAYSFTPQAGAWHHVAYTFDSTSLKEQLFLDGTAVASGTAPGVPVYTPNPQGLYFATDVDVGTPDYGFVGQLVDVRLYGVARTAADIAADMSGCLPASGSGLVAYYPFGEGSGQVLHDFGPNQLNGSIVADAPNWTCGGPSVLPALGAAPQCTQ